MTPNVVEGINIDQGQPNKGKKQIFKDQRAKI